MDSTPENTGLSPEEYERRKTTEAQMEDYAYTINHAIACTATDWIDPLVGNQYQKLINNLSGNTEHGHSHGGEGNLWRWVVGEFVGDFGAVPVTVMFQRWAPGFMNSLRSVMEPVLGPLFRRGAHTATHKWAKEQGISTESQEAREHERQIYEHEVRHLPQALMWTASSSAINIATQRALGNHGPIWQLATGKALGAAITAGLVVGFRGFAPHTAEKWDNWTSKNIFLPLTEVVGGTIGVKKEDVERLRKKQEEAERGKSWAARVGGGEALTGPTVG